MQLTAGDQKFLEQFVEALKQVVLASPNLMFGVKNANSQTIFYSQNYADFLEISLTSILGQTTVAPLYDDPAIEQVILNEDQQVLRERQPLRLLKINKVAARFKPYICLKSPIINPASNQVVGILLQGLEISVLNLNQLIIDSYSTLKQQRPRPQQLPNLSKRERQIIFLFMAQLTSQEIADVIHKLENKKVSKSTIDSVFNDQLYPKFGVSSRSALFDKLQKLNYDKLIPSDILTSMSIPLAIVKSF